MSRPTRFVWVAVSTVLVGLLVVGLVVFQATGFADREAHRDCERAIASRHDSRTMWLYLIDTAKADPKKVQEFSKKLDELLPPLVCDDGDNWVPKQ